MLRFYSFVTSTNISILQKVTKYNILYYVKLHVWQLTILEKYIEKYKYTCIYFIDYVESFDVVHRAEMMACLEMIGIVGKRIVQKSLVDV